jgi:hypothetical protein
MPIVGREADLRPALNLLESLVSLNAGPDIVFTVLPVGTSVNDFALSRHGFSFALQTKRQQRPQAAEAQAQNEEAGSDLGRWQTAAAHVCRLQGHRATQKARQPAWQDRQPAKERLCRGEPTRGRPGNQAGAFHGAIAVCR